MRTLAWVQVGQVDKLINSYRSSPSAVTVVPVLGRCEYRRRTEKLPAVWAIRDYPVLLAVTRRFDEGAHWVTVEEIEADTGLDREQVERAATELSRRDFFEVRGAFGRPVMRVHDLSGQAYLFTGLHPDGDDAISRLIDALRQAAEQVSDPAEKSRLRRLADNAGSVSRDVLAAVLAAVITGGLAH